MKTVLGVLLISLAVLAKAQSTDIFLMPGADVTRPGSGLRSNLNIGVGHTFGSLNSLPIGDELTAAYTYENSGSRGFWHTNYGSHTEAIGLMRNIGLSRSPFGLYLWSQAGITSLTGYSEVRNRLYSGVSFGLTYRMSPHGSIWAQASYNKIETEPWYTSSNIGYVFSF